MNPYRKIENGIGDKFQVIVDDPELLNIFVIAINSIFKANIANYRVSTMPDIVDIYIISITAKAGKKAFAFDVLKSKIMCY